MHEAIPHDCNLWHVFRDLSSLAMKAAHQDDGEDVQQGSAQAAGKGLPATPKMEEMVSHRDRVEDDLREDYLQSAQEDDRSSQEGSNGAADFKRQGGTEEDLCWSGCGI